MSGDGFQDMPVLAGLFVIAIVVALFGMAVSDRARTLSRAFLGAAIFAAGLAIAAMIMLVMGLELAFARDLGQWVNTDPAVRAWYENLKQPDNPAVSCCGEADAYWCDDIHVRAGHTFCAITDTRPDAPLGRPHRAIGQEFEIPDTKLKWDRGNPTGHAIVFLSTTGFVYCFVQGGGV